MTRLLAIMMVLALAGGCLVPSPSPMAVTRLYCGMNGVGGPITDARFIKFVDEEVTPRFPDGLTIYDCRGQWRGQDGRLIREQSRVIEIVHSDDPSSRAAIEAIRGRYKSCFSQESVLLMRSRPAMTSF